MLRAAALTGTQPPPGGRSPAGATGSLRRDGCRGIPSGRARRLDHLGDVELLRALALDVDGAAEVFVRRFQGRVCGVVFAVLGCSRDVEDIAQQTFVKAWRSAGSFDPQRGSVAGWLCRIARNTSLDSVRARGSVPFDAEALLARCDAAGQWRDPAQDVCDAGDAVRVRAQLDRLPVEQRRALLLATVGSRTMAEIAAIEQVPVPTVKTRIRLAVRRVRHALDEENTP